MANDKQRPIDLFCFYQSTPESFLIFPSKIEHTLANEQNFEKLPKLIRDSFAESIRARCAEIRLAGENSFLCGLFLSGKAAVGAMEERGLNKETYGVFSIDIPDVMSPCQIRSVEPKEHCNNCRFRMFEADYDRRLPLGCLVRPGEHFYSGGHQVCSCWEKRLPPEPYA